MMQDEEDEGGTYDHTSLLDLRKRKSPTTMWCCSFIKTVCLSLTFLTLGLCIAIPGPTLLDLKERIHTDTTHMALIFTARSIGYLLGSLIGGFLFDHFDKQLLLMVTLIVAALATGITPWSLTLTVLALMMSLQGMSMGVLDTGGNAYCVRIWGKRSPPYIQAMHFAFGVGAFIAPLLSQPFLSNTPVNLSTNTFQQGLHPMTVSLTEFLGNQTNASNFSRHARDSPNINNTLPPIDFSYSSTKDVSMTTTMVLTLAPVAQAPQKPKKPTHIDSTTEDKQKADGNKYLKDINDKTKDDPEKNPQSKHLTPRPPSDRHTDPVNGSGGIPPVINKGETNGTEPGNSVLLTPNINGGTSTPSPSTNSPKSTSENSTPSKTAVKKTISDSTPERPKTKSSTNTNSTATTSNQKPTLQNITTLAPSPALQTQPSTSQISTTKKPPTSQTSTTKKPPTTTTQTTTTQIPTTTTQTSTTTQIPTTTTQTSTTTQIPTTTTTQTSPISTQKATQTTTTKKPSATKTTTIRSTSTGTPNPTSTDQVNGSTTTVYHNSTFPIVRRPKKPSSVEPENILQAVGHMSRVQMAYLIIGAMLLVNGFLFCSLYCYDRYKSDISVYEDTDAGHDKFGNPCKRYVIMSMMFLFFLAYIGMETTFGGLLMTFTVNFKGWTKDKGAIVTAIFWGSLAAGRGFSIFIANCFRPTCMLAIDLCLMLIGSALLSFGISYYDAVLWIGTLTLGFGMSSMFPTAISWIDQYFKMTGKSTAVLVMGSAMGQMIVPVTTGYFYEYYLKMSLMYSCLALSILLSILFVIMQFIASRDNDLSTHVDTEGFTRLRGEENLEMDDVSYGTTANGKRRFMPTFSDTEYNQLLQDEDEEDLLAL